MNVNVPKNGKQKPEKIPTKEFGREPSGNEGKPKDLKPTRYVAIVELKVRYPIIPIMQFTDDQNISTLPVLSGYATGVIEVFINESFNVPSVSALLQCPRVKGAMSVLVREIEYELQKIRNGGGRSKIK